MKSDGLEFFVRSGWVFLLKSKNGTIGAKELRDGENHSYFLLYPCVSNPPCPVPVRFPSYQHISLLPYYIVLFLQKISGKAHDFSRGMKAPQCFF